MKQVKDVRKIQLLGIEEKSIVMISHDLFNSIDFSTGNQQSKQLYLVFNIIDNILNYPYQDEVRILYLSHYKSPLFRADTTLKFLKTLGFELNGEVMTLPYDKPVRRLMLAREALVGKLVQKLE